VEYEIGGGTCRNALLTREVSKCFLATLTSGVITHHMAGQACMSGVYAAGFALLSKWHFPKQRTCVSFKIRTSRAAENNGNSFDV